MASLLQETLAAVAASGHNESDIVWIGTRDREYGMSREEFTILADHEYDKGFGAPMVPVDLIVEFRDGTHMWRGEYDGQEWWEYVAPAPRRVYPSKKITQLFSSSGYETVAEVQANRN